MVKIHKGDVVLVHRRYTYTYVDGREEIASSFAFGIAEKVVRGSVTLVRLASGALYHIAPLGQQVHLCSNCGPELFAAAQARNHGEPFDTLQEARDFARPFRKVTATP